MTMEENASGFGDLTPAIELQRLDGIGKSPYPGRLNVRYKADASNLSKACIFSSFSFSGEVEEYVFYYLDELKKAGFSTVFVSTSILPKRSVQRLSQYVCLIIERDKFVRISGRGKQDYPYWIGINSMPLYLQMIASLAHSLIWTILFFP